MTNNSKSSTDDSFTIQLTTNKKSIWRGDIWSTFHVQITNIHEKYLQNRSFSNQRFKLHSFLEHIETKKRYYVSDHMDTLALSFQSYPCTMDSSQALLIGDETNVLEVQIRKNLFAAGDIFRVCVAICDRKDLKEETVGFSSNIRVTDMTLYVQQYFSENPFVMLVEDKVFAWYHKVGDRETSLTTMIHLKHASGLICNPFLDPLEVRIELLYEDDTPAPLYINSMCDEGDCEPLLCQIDPKDTLFRSGEVSKRFRFRIGEASSRHPGHSGFKLRFYPCGDYESFVHPALLEEVIVVLPQPKSTSFINSLMTKELPEIPEVDSRLEEHDCPMCKSFNESLGTTTNASSGGVGMMHTCGSCADDNGTKSVKTTSTNPFDDDWEDQFFGDYSSDPLPDIVESGHEDGDEDEDGKEDERIGGYITENELVFDAQSAMTGDTSTF